MHTGDSWWWRISTRRRFVHQEAGHRRMGAHISRGQSQHDQRASALQMGCRSHDLRGANRADHHSHLAFRHGRCAAQLSTVYFQVRQEDHRQCGRTHRHQRFGQRAEEQEHTGTGGTENYYRSPAGENDGEH